MGETKTKRDALIYGMRKQGWTYSIIGENFGLSVGRVRQICESMSKNGLDQFPVYFNLTKRTARRLKAMKLFTEREIVKAVKDQRLYPKCIEGYGEKSHIEVLTMFNLDRFMQVDNCEG